MSNIPLRRKGFDVAGFLAFVTEQGGEVGTPTNPYEVVRYRAYWRGANKSVVHIVYAKENGLLTWCGGSKEHYQAFLDGTSMDELPGAHPVSTQSLSKSERRRAELLARDGGDCWFCGQPMGDDCTVEHLIPKSKGGRDTLANYALAHRKCNNDAADLPLVEKIAMRAKAHAAARNEES